MNENLLHLQTIMMAHGETLIDENGYKNFPDALIAISRAWSKMNDKNKLRVVEYIGGEN